MTKENSYYVLMDGEYKLLDFRALARILKNSFPRPFIWSARLSTGLMGLTNCSAGNKGPKARNEVLLALGDRGLAQLIDLGFITCPVCKPENTTGFWEAAKEAVAKKYGLATLAEFADKTILPFDARRIKWEEVIPAIKQWPGRLYVPQGLQKSELAELKSRIKRIGYGFPLVGYYDRQAPERFTEYNLD